MGECASTNCEDNCTEEDWSYCGKRNCASCGGGCGKDGCVKCNPDPKWGSDKKASNDRAFRTGWAVVKAGGLPATREPGDVSDFDPSKYRNCSECNQMMPKHYFTSHSDKCPSCSVGRKDKFTGYGPDNKYPKRSSQKKGE